MATAVTGAGVGSGVDSSAGKGVSAGIADDDGSGAAGATGSAVGTGDGVTGSGVVVTAGLSTVGEASLAGAAAPVSSFRSIGADVAVADFVSALRASSSPNTVGDSVMVAVELMSL